MIKKPRVHIFVCTNFRDGSRRCCGPAGIDAHAWLKRLVECGHFEPGSIRVSRSGCMGACNEGPVLTSYPAGHWYAYSSFEDLEAILGVEVLREEGGVNHLRIDLSAAENGP